MGAEERWRRVRELFHEAAARPPAERDAFLQAACAGQPDLYQELRGLLAGDRQSGSVVGDAIRSVARDLDEPALVGSRIGPYRLLERIAEGGMGTVYLAEHGEPDLERRVAIKLVRRGMEAEFVLSRFRRERQILSALEHPGIARLYDGGTTEAGLPYFVMEYVEGVDLLSWCDSRRLSVDERIRLFRRVCEAVQYAHQHLVVHRDLKPSNILVTPQGDPKLLDFGIAKLLAAPGEDEASEHTATALRLMTPEYASPEQVRGERVTTASDVYALGVLLYELLSGHRPYRIRGRQSSEIERAVLQDEPGLLNWP